MTELLSERLPKNKSLEKRKTREMQKLLGGRLQQSVADKMLKEYYCNCAEKRGYKL